MIRVRALIVLVAAGVCASIAFAGQPRAVRGVWLTNVDSRVLNSRAGIEQAVDLCDSLGFNTIFVVTWNKSMTTYPSAIMERLTGVAIDTQFTGRDPLRELIDVAHRKKIRVIAWFEFGFSASYQQQGGPILRAKPEWASRDVHGDLVTKNGFEWMNGFLPDVQDFMLSLIMEVVTRYDVDGIQGDDRLPAMPSESGYDAYTVDRYRAEHGGANPPTDAKDPAWVQWRADLLNAFMKRIHDTVKAVNPRLIISMSPSVYPWSKEEYLQDWPTWVQRGWVDMVHPQVYRYSLTEYAATLREMVNGQLTKEELAKCFPGVLLKLGPYAPSREFLTGMLQENRSHGIQGEVMFFYEGLRAHADVFREWYHDRAEFPAIEERQ